VESGRVAEVKWKVRFAALCLAVTTIAFFEVNDGVDAVRVLRDSYIAWGIFVSFNDYMYESEAIILEKYSPVWFVIDCLRIFDYLI